jgi:Na+/proline symporter
MVSWLLLALYGGALVVLAPGSSDRGGFFEGRTRRGASPTTGWLFASLFIAWIFAKSVTNAANLGAQLGLPGAVAYAGYWLSIPVGGLTIVALRKRFGATSLASWLAARYGRAAAATFMLAVLIRLYNEVWSNTAVVGSYFGAKGTTAYYAGALAFTAVTLAYTLKGGLRTSIWTDAVHAAVFAAFVALVVIVVVGGSGPSSVRRIAGAWQ